MTQTEWTDYLERNNRKQFYKCPKCGGHDGIMKHREVREPSGDSHKEYQITCVACSFKTGAHLSRELTEKIWEAAKERY